MVGWTRIRGKIYTPMRRVASKKQARQFGEKLKKKKRITGYVTRVEKNPFTNKKEIWVFRKGKFGRGL